MDYIFARFVLGIVGLGSFALIAIGVLLAMTGVGIGVNSVMHSSYAGVVPAAALAAVPGTIIAFMGVFLMAVVDHFSATLDTATYSKKLLRIAEEQLRVSKQVLKLGELVQAGYGAAGQPEPESNGQSVARGFLSHFGRKPADNPQDRRSFRNTSVAPEHAPESLEDDADTRPALEDSLDIPAIPERPMGREPQLTKTIEPGALTPHPETVPRVPPDPTR